MFIPKSSDVDNNGRIVRSPDAFTSVDTAVVIADSQENRVFY